MRNEIQFYQPLAFVGKRRATGLDEDVCEYGVRIQPTTELTWFTYDWGWGFTLRVLGFGFEYTRFGFE